MRPHDGLEIALFAGVVPVFDHGHAAEVMRLTADLARGFGAGALEVDDGVRPVDRDAFAAAAQLVVEEIAAGHAEERGMFDGIVVDDEAAFGVHLGDPGPGEGVGVTEFDGLAVDGGVHGEFGVHAFHARLGVGAEDGFEGVLLTLRGGVAHGAADEIPGGHGGDVAGQIVCQAVVGQTRQPPARGDAVPPGEDVADFVQTHACLGVLPQQRAQQFRSRHPIRGQSFPVNNKHGPPSHVRPP